MANYDALTDEERKFIKKHSQDMTTEEIALSLGRNYYTIHKELKRIGIRSYHKWTEEEDAILMALWKEKYCADYISKRMKIDKDSIYNRIRTMKRNGKWIPKNKEL